MPRRKRRGMNPLVYFGLAIILFSMVTLGFSIWGTGEIQPFAIDTGVQDGDFIESSNSFFGVPTYGRIACEESDETVTTSTQKFGAIRLSCNTQERSELVEECTVILYTPSTSQVEDYSRATLNWNVCVVGQPCDVGAGEETQNNWNIKLPDIYGGVDDSKTNVPITISLTENEYIYAEYRTGGFFDLTFDDMDLTNDMRATVSYKPFFLYRYDIFSETNGEAIENSQDCIVGELTEGKFAITGIKGGGRLTESLVITDTTDIDSLRLSRETQVTYLTNFVGVVPQYQLFDGDMKYCYDKKINAVEEVETPSGTFKLANTGSNRELETVDCCNTADAIEENGAGYYCEDFEIKKYSESEGIACDNYLNRCPIVGYQAYEGGKFYYQECVDGKCVSDYIEAECSYNTDCANGYCNVDRQNPEDSECITPVIVDSCGKNGCEPEKGETYYTCPQDCAPIPPDDNEFLIYLFIGLGFLAVIIIMLIIAQRMRQNGGGGF